MEKLTHLATLLADVEGITPAAAVDQILTAADQALKINERAAHKAQKLADQERVSGEAAAAPVNPAPPVTTKKDTAAAGKQ